MQILNQVLETNLTLIALVCFSVSFLYQAFHILFFLSRVGFNRSPKTKAKQGPVSVIICARDEAENLKKFLPEVLNQDYSDFEVIVVNDCSQDHSEDVLEAFQKDNKHLKVTTIKKDEKFTHGKKLALTIGIKAARYEWLLLTDADCKPESREWLKEMQKNFTQTTSIVLGYGGYAPSRSLINVFTRYETLYNAMQYLGFAMAGIPYMGVGRNLAYRKSLFFEQKGFASHRQIASGDDDLFVNRASNHSNTRVEYSVNSLTRSVSETRLGDWIQQKKRHLTTGSYYNRRSKILLGSEYISRILFFASMVFLTLDQEYLYLVLGLFLLRWILLAVVLKKAMLRLKEKDLFLPSFILDLIMPIINVLLVISNRFSSPQPKWK